MSMAPQDQDAEQATVGAMLMEREAIARVVSLLQVSDFYGQVHRTIYEAITALFDRGEPVDVVTLSSHLRDAGALDDVGGMRYLLDLMSACPTAWNVKQYARTVREKAAARDAQRLAQRVITAGDGGWRDAAARLGVLAEASRAGAAQRQRGLTVVSAAELLTTPPEPVAYTVEKIIPETAMGWITGSPGVGKTFLALEMARCIVTGQPWCDTYTVRPCPVLYLDLEKTAGLMHRRLWALTLASSEGPAVWIENDPALYIASGYLALDSDEGVAELGELLATHKPGLVIADSWAKWLGGLDENASGDMARATATLARLTDEHGCGWLILAHPPKARPDHDVPEAALRGSGDLAARADYAFECRRLPCEDDERKLFHLRQTKNRVGAQLESLVVELADTGGGGVTFSLSEDPSSWGAKVERAEAAILAHLAQAGETTRQDLVSLVTETDLPERVANEALSSLRKRQPPVIESRRMGKQAAYSLASKRPEQGRLEG